MYLNNLIDNLFDRFPTKTNKTDPDLRKKYIRNLNISHHAVYRSYNWEFRKRTAQLLVVPNYTTGLCTTTKYSGSNWSAASTVNLSVALNADMAGRYFQPNAGTNWYRIVYAPSGATQLILENPIVEDSQTNVTFKIWKRFHTLNTDVSTILDFGKWDRGALDYRQYSDKGSNRFENDWENGSTPSEFSVYGKDEFSDAYTTGSVAIANDSNLVVGTGTSWLGNATPGDLFVVNNKNYRVKTVQNDTRIILQNYVTPAVTAGSTYEIKKEMSYTVKIYTDSTSYLTLPYDYLARSYDMIHETKDRTAMPDDFDEVIVDFAMYMIMEDKDDPTYLATAEVARQKLISLKSKFRVVYPKKLNFPPTIPATMPGR